MDCLKTHRSSTPPRHHGFLARPTTPLHRFSALWASCRHRTIHRTSLQIHPPMPRLRRVAVQIAEAIDSVAIVKRGTLREVLKHAWFHDSSVLAPSQPKEARASECEPLSCKGPLRFWRLCLSDVRRPR